MAGKSRRADNPMLVRTESLGELVAAIEGPFSTGTHEACRMLKCSRDWFSANVAPRVHYVFVTSAGRVALKYEDTPLSASGDQCWYNTAELVALIEGHTRIEQRSKRFALESFIDPENRDAFNEAVKRRQLTDFDVATAPDPADRSFKLRERRELVEKALNETGARLLEAALASPGRAAAPWFEAGVAATSLAVIEFVRGGWRTVADMMEYGDAAETHYRRLYAEGALRCTIELPKDGGGTTRHVMWCPDPMPAPRPEWLVGASPTWVPASLEVWQQYVSGIGNI